MNEILQKRIKEAAYEESSTYDLTEIKESNAAYNAAIKVATFILQNQWISVEEALPDRGSVVFIRFDHGGYSVRMFTNYDRSFADVKGGNITHWMPIPSLKGGER